MIEREDQDAPFQIVGPSGLLLAPEDRLPGPFRGLAIAQLGAIFPEYEVCDFEHIADGGVHFNLVPRASAGDNPSRIAALRDHVLEMAVRDFGASFSGEHGIGRANQAAYDELTPVAVQKYSAAVTVVFARMPAAAVRFGPPQREERDLND